MTPPKQVLTWGNVKEVKVLPADDPKKLKLGWVIYEEIGVCIINDDAIAKVSTGPENDGEIEVKWPPKGGTYHGDESRWDL